MSTSHGLHKRLDSDLIAQIESTGKVQKRPKQSKSKSFRHIQRRKSKPEVKHRPFTGRIRKNQKRTEYF